MGKIGDKTKIVLVKSYILLVFSWMLFMFFVGFQVETGLKPEWEKIYLLVIVIHVFLVLIMIALLNKIDISPSKVDPIMKAIKVKDYYELKEIIFKQAVDQGFDNPYLISINENVENTLAFKKDHGVTYVLQTIWMQELNMELLNTATEEFWKETEGYVGENEILSQTIGLMQCVCVQKMNGVLRKYIIQNVHQEYKRYQILSVVSFGGRRGYICQSRGGFFRSYYRFLKREFDYITTPIWDLSKKV